MAWRELVRKRLSGLRQMYVLRGLRAGAFFARRVPGALRLCETPAGTLDGSFRAHPFFCARRRALVAGRPASEHAAVRHKCALPDLTEPRELTAAGERAIFVAGPVISGTDEDPARIELHVQTLPALGAREPRRLLTSIPLNAGCKYYEYCFRGGRLCLWEFTKILNERVTVATLVPLGGGENLRLIFFGQGFNLCSNIRFDRMPLAFALGGERFVAVSGGARNVRVSVWDVGTKTAAFVQGDFRAETRIARKLFESKPLADEAEDVAPISVEVCANGWYCVKVEISTAERSANVCYFFSPDLAFCHGGCAGIYPTSEVRHVPACTAGEPGLFVFDSDSPSAADPRVEIDAMRRCLSAQGLAGDGAESAVFVDTEGLLDADERDLPPPLLAKKLYLRPMVRVRELRDAF